MSLSRKSSPRPPAGRPGRASWFARVVVAFVSLAALGIARGFAANPIEYQLKASFLFNFAKFVEWPTLATAPGAGVRLGILAPDDVYQLLEKSLAGRMAGDRPILVERVYLAQLEKGETLPHILFLQRDALRGGAEPALAPERIAALLAAQPVLLVGESAGFATSGGMIGFVQRGENLRFQVNLSGAQRAGLKLSARLSTLAEIVSSPTQP